MPAPTRVDILAIVVKTFFTDFSSGLSSSGLDNLYNAKFIVSLCEAAPCHKTDKSPTISSWSSSKSAATSLEICLILKSAKVKSVASNCSASFLTYSCRTLSSAFASMYSFSGISESPVLYAGGFGIVTSFNSTANTGSAKFRINAVKNNFFICSPPFLQQELN